MKNVNVYYFGEVPKITRAILTIVFTLFTKKKNTYIYKGQSNGSWTLSNSVKVGSASRLGTLTFTLPYCKKKKDSDHLAKCYFMSNKKKRIRTSFMLRPMYSCILRVIFFDFFPSSSSFE